MTVTNDPMLVSGEAALAEFRARLTGADFFDRLDRGGGRLLAQLPVGVGKSVWLAEAARYAVTSARPDALVVVVAPRLGILRETRDRLTDLRPRVLTGRPRRRCGALDAPWVTLEQAGCSALARATLCERCPVKSSCSWPGRWNRLRDARLVLAAQQQVRANPNFIELLRVLTGAASVLTLVDESDLLLQPFRHRVRREDIIRLAALAGVTTTEFDGSEWNTILELLTGANDENLRAGDWTLPRPSREWVLEVQRLGHTRYGADFRYVGYDLRLFAASDPASRGWEGDALTFSAGPNLGDEFAIFTGSIATGLVNHRLDPDRAGFPLHAPFDGLRFVHPGTRWININNRAGAARYFPGNHERVLDFFARLIGKNIRCGKRTLLVCRKKFRVLSQRVLTERLNALGVGSVTIVTGDWDRHDLTDPRNLPLITYGVSGINRFELFDAVFCLTGYYTTPVAVEELVNDLEAPANRVPIQLGFTGTPARRTATVAEPTALHTVVPDLAHWALSQKEADVVVQAVGRVRPFTRPREVITFQAGDLPGVVYDHEFTTLGQAREFFGMVNARAERTRVRVAEARRLSADGRTWDEIAKVLNVGSRTVARYLRGASPGTHD